MKEEGRLIVEKEVPTSSYRGPESRLSKAAAFIIIITRGRGHSKQFRTTTSPRLYLQLLFLLFAVGLLFGPRIPPQLIQADGSGIG